MQIGSYNNNQQNFGMAIKADKHTVAVLERRLKPQDWEGFNELVKTQKDNPVNITLRNFDPKGTISAIIDDGESISELATESGFRLFKRSPLKFIEKQADRADELNEARMNMQEAKAAVLNEIV